MCTILSFPLVSFVLFSRPRALMNSTNSEKAPDAISSRDCLVRKHRIAVHPAVTPGDYEFITHPALIRVGSSQTSTTTKPSSSQAHTMITTRASKIQACITPHGPGHDWLSTNCLSLSGPRGKLRPRQRIQGQDLRVILVSSRRRSHRQFGFANQRSDTSLSRRGRGIAQHTRSHVVISLFHFLFTHDKHGIFDATRMFD